MFCNDVNSLHEAYFTHTRSFDIYQILKQIILLFLHLRVYGLIYFVVLLINRKMIINNKNLIAMKSEKLIAVVVPIYKNSFTEYEKYSFYHNADILSERDTFLLGPKRLEKYLISLSKTIKNGYVTIVDEKYFGSLNANSRLMMNYQLYDIYKSYNYMLICHFDAYIFEDKLDYWISLKLDLIGAPLFKHNKNSIEFLDKGRNGGFSLRNIQTSLKVLKESRSYFTRIHIMWKSERILHKKILKIINHGFIYNYKFPYLRKKLIFEDIYWSEIVPSLFPYFKIANFEQSRNFAFEVNPRLLLELNNGILPMGIHAWWKYDKGFCLELIKRSDSIKLNKSLKMLDKLS